MNGPTAGLAHPLVFAQAILGSLQTTGVTAGVWQTLDFNTNILSVLDGVIDRPTASRFRALVPGYYRYRYTGTASLSNNQRGGLFRVLRNTLTEIDGSQAAVFANDGTIVKAGSASEEGIVLMAANDFLELQANPHDGSAMRVQAVTSFALELVRFL